MTIIQDGQVTTTISRIFTPADADGIIVIVDNNLAGFKSKFGVTEDTVTVNAFVDEIFCFARIKSLAEAPPPYFELTDSESDRLNKTLAYEWGTAPRFELKVWSRRNPGTTLTPTPWSIVGSTSLTNPTGYPWRRYRILDLLTDNLGRKLGADGQIGISIANAGFGLMQSVDEITIDGSFTQEVVIFQPQNPAVQHNNYFHTVGTAKQTLMEANERRTTFNITNTSISQSLYLDYGPNVSTTTYTALLTPGQNHPGMAGYKGVISILGSAANTRVTGRESML